MSKDVFPPSISVVAHFTSEIIEFLQNCFFYYLTGSGFLGDRVTHVFDLNEPIK